MTQLSTAFILPIFNFSEIIKKSYSKTYLGHRDYEGKDKWGNYLYLQVTSELLDGILLSELRNHERYVTELDEEDYVFFVFEFLPFEKENIVDPFLTGKYSQINKDYVNKYFPMRNKNGSVSMNWRILSKDNWDIPKEILSLREYWLRRIGSPIPEDDEVWPKPKMEHEIFNHVILDEIIEEELKDINLSKAIHN